MQKHRPAAGVDDVAKQGALFLFIARCVKSTPWMLSFTTLS